MTSPTPTSAQLIVAHAALEPRYATPTRWAVDRLLAVLAVRGVTAVEIEDHEDMPPAAVQVVLMAANGAASQGTGSSPESFSIDHPSEDVPIVISASHGRGLAYGVLELADRAEHSSDPLAAIRSTPSAALSPASPVRSILRTFACEEEDKEWYYDRTFWTEYLTELATQRINRFHLAMGMQYNYSHAPEGASDNYFCFPYPFLLDVPGHDVQAKGITGEERGRNLDTLRFVSSEAARRGIHFQLGLWNHAYDQGFPPRYPIEGLSPETHAAYCAAALEQLLRECPDIAGLTLRVHYEGGIPEPGHADFWRPVLNAAATVGRPIEIDMHAKGVDQELIDIATGTGLPVVISAKYWAEHQGLPYHQARIRDMERATKNPGTGLNAITAYERRFTRYGYGDFLKEDRNFDVLYRIWPGTQRVLVWGDPVLAAGYGRLGTLAGSIGTELSEPLTFSGRMGSGAAGHRDPYLDPSLQLGVAAWKKYKFTYRVWGRLLYNPDSPREEWIRALRATYGEAADNVAEALAAASRVLPFVTVVHGLGASNNGYWPEIYMNMPIAGGPNTEHYERDTEQPSTFAHVSSFDPALFYPIDEFVDDALHSCRDGRYTPIDTAERLAQLADTSEASIDAATRAVPDVDEPQFRRLAIDIRVQAGLARFFAGKTLAGVDMCLYEHTQRRQFLESATQHYQSARDAWAKLAELTTGIYRADLTFGIGRSEHGHWADRLPAIDADLALLEQLATSASPESASANETHAVDLTTGPADARVTHESASPFQRGQTVPIRATVDEPDRVAAVRLHYRHLNQGADWTTVDMASTGAKYEAHIPGEYTDSPFPIQYYFTLHSTDGNAGIVPGLSATLDNQPYHVVRQQHPYVSDSPVLHS